MHQLLTDAPVAKVPGQRRLLALDGGGIRGVLTLEVLTAFETMLREEHSDDDIVLSDYFDYFAGTSTGAMIAAGLARGWPVQRLMDIYVNDGAAMFDRLSLRRWIAKLFRYKYDSKKLTAAMKREFGAETPFGDDGFRSLLLAVLHSSTSDSPWPLSNNPAAKYNDTERSDCNLDIPLWNVLRASTAAPVYFPPESVQVGERTFVFVDGGITPFNNPALQLYFQATQPAYRLEWETGVDKLLLVSMGTGSAAQATPGLTPGRMNVLHTAKTLPASLMGGSAWLQDVACRSIGHCVHGDHLDNELGDMASAPGDPERSDRAFTYLRFDVDLTVDGMDGLGLSQLADEDIVAGLRKLDAIDNIDALRTVGRALGQQVRPELFGPFDGVARPTP